MSQLSYRTLWEEIRSQKHSFWRSNLYGILTTLLLLPIPLLIPLLIDEILLHHPGQLTAFFSERVGISSPAGIIVAVTVTVLLLRISAFLTSAYRTRHAVKISGRVGYALRHRILRRMERLALSYRRNRRPHDSRCGGSGKFRHPTCHPGTLSCDDAPWGLLRSAMDRLAVGSSGLSLQPFLSGICPSPGT